MFFDLKSYFAGKHGGVYAPPADLPSYLMGRAKSGGIQEITGTLPLAVPSRASQVLNNYIIYGESVQDGTPTPENPVEVTGLGVRTENLFGKDSAVIMNNTALYSDGTTTRENGSYCAYIPCKGNTKYTISKTPSMRLRVGSTEGIPDIGMRVNNYYNSTSTKLATITTSGNDKYLFIYYYSYVNGDRIPEEDIRATIMVVEGSTAPSSYIPYGYKLPLKVTSNGTTTDYPIYIGDSQLMRIPNTEYADYVDYEKGKIVRRVKKLVLTGEEAWYFYDRAFFTDRGFNNDYLIDSTSVLIASSHYEGTRQVANVYQINNYQIAFSSNSDRRLFIKHDSINTVSGLTTFLADQYAAGTPVTVWYVLETPVEEDPPVPLPDITIPKGEVTIDIEGGLKPQATIKGLISPTT